MFRYFPFYLNIEGKTALIIGGGRIACRRLKSLLKFDIYIKLVAKSISEEIRDIKSDRLELYEQEFTEEFLHGVSFVIMATDDKELHKELSGLARDNGVWVNDAADRKNCDFYFPSIVEHEEMIISVSNQGNNHSLTKRVADEIREYLGNTDRER